MKNFTLRAFFLLLVLASTPLWAGDHQLLPNFEDRGTVVARSNLISDFRARLEAAIESRDAAAIQGLYQTNGVAAEELKGELTRWQQLLRVNTKVGVALWLKELSTLPPQACESWTKYAHQLTKREVTHLVWLSFPSSNSFRLELPLVQVEGKLLVVASDKK